MAVHKHFKVHFPLEYSAKLLTKTIFGERKSEKSFSSCYESEIQESLKYFIDIDLLQLLKFTYIGPKALQVYGLMPQKIVLCTSSYCVVKLHSL